MPDQTGETNARTIKIIGHSKIIYWWPVWLFGYILAVYAAIDSAPSSTASWHTFINFLYICLMLFIITVTNIKLDLMRTVIVILLVVILLGAIFLIFGHISLVKDIPAFLVFMNASFFIVFSTGLLFIWLASLFVIDRLTVWVLKPGSRWLIQRSFSGKIDHNLNDAAAHPIVDDIPCHKILGLGCMGDIIFRFALPEPYEVHIHNVYKPVAKSNVIHSSGDGGKAARPSGVPKR
jgi:hypothetical protein